MLQDTAAFLAATCEPNTSEDLKKKFDDLTLKWNGMYNVGILQR